MTLLVKKVSVFFALILSLLLLSACSSQSSSEPTVDATRLFHNALLTATWSVPTWTPAPSKTAAPTLIPSAIFLPSATFTCTPVAFSNYHVIGASYVNSNLMFSISVPGISGQFWALVNNTRYNCAMQPNTADMLYCSGAALPAGTNAAISVFRSDNSQQAVMVMTMAVPQNPLLVKTAVINLQPTLQSPAAPAPAQTSCSDWCAVNKHNDGTEMKQCGFKTKDEAYQKALDVDRGCPAVPGTDPGTYVNYCVYYGAVCSTGG